jgi:hypothetical protein
VIWHIRKVTYGQIGAQHFVSSATVVIVTEPKNNTFSFMDVVERMNERRLTKEICGPDMGDNAVRGRSTRTLLNQIGQVLEKGQVKSTRNRRTKNLMKVQEAKGVCKDRSKWKEVISAYPNGKRT